ncbi:UNVERIFIED_CONTAM: hypothetical protein Slati_0892800 [Sesamum latifolium]|uniref:Uncharacterized protein n=1 Tax=Sesamum latifolium TaxID=2727402 RepID=A0AAW2XS25_9LAMI
MVRRLIPRFPSKITFLPRRSTVQSSADGVDIESQNFGKFTKFGCWKFIAPVAYGGDKSGSRLARIADGYNQHGDSLDAGSICW